MWKALGSTVACLMLVAFAWRDGLLGDPATTLLIAGLAVVAAWMWARWRAERQAPRDPDA